MIAAIRHNISLLVCLFGVIAGAVLLLIGVTNTVGGLLFAAAVQNSVEMSVQNSVQFDKSIGPSIRWEAVLAILLQHVLVAAGGAALLFFAGRAFIRRWRAGPPSEEEAVGKSPITRLIALLLYGAGAAYGAYGLIFGIDPIFRDAQLAANGDTVLAQVGSIEPAPEIHWDVYEVHYTFRTQSGEEFSGFSRQFSHTANEMLNEGTVEVTYALDDPTHSKARFSFSVPFALFFFGQNFIFLLIGVWGFAKNAQAMVPPAGGEAPRPAPVPDSELRPRGQRPNFARRGL